MQLFVDEAPDFSAVQLACMVELSDPKLRSWFTCGDFRQRITSSRLQVTTRLSGSSGVTQIGNLEVREISGEYRQSARLKELARALSIQRDSNSIIASQGIPRMIRRHC